jgi:L-glyceraldehyde 3-phosphate reductase
MRPYSPRRIWQTFRALNDIALRRGQSLAQMALAWVLRRPEVTTALIGASKVSQIDDCVAALKSPNFSPEELVEIDRYAKDGNLNLWAKSSSS